MIARFVTGCAIAAPRRSHSSVWVTACGSHLVTLREYWPCQTTTVTAAWWRRSSDAHGGLFCVQHALQPKWRRRGSSLLECRRACNELRPRWPHLRGPGAYSNDAKLSLLFSAAMEACDGLDGAKDGNISNPAACRFDIAPLRCAGRGDAGDTCLSDAQIAAIRWCS